MVPDDLLVVDVDGEAEGGEGNKGGEIEYLAVAVVERQTAGEVEGDEGGCGCGCEEWEEVLLEVNPAEHEPLETERDGVADVVRIKCDGGELELLETREGAKQVRRRLRVAVVGAVPVES